MNIKQVLIRISDAFYFWGYCLLEKAIFYAAANIAEDGLKPKQMFPDSPRSKVPSSPRTFVPGEIPPAPPMPPTSYWLKKPRDEILHRVIEIVDTAIHKLHKALSIKTDHPLASLHIQLCSIFCWFDLIIRKDGSSILSES